MSLILETPRLILRLQQASDIDFLVELWADPQVTAYLGGPRDREWLRGELHQAAQHPAAQKYDLWLLLEKPAMKPVGHCGLLEKESEGTAEIELTYVLAPPVWGMGYATEIARALKLYAFDTLGVDRLVALVHPGNQASEQVAIRAGMRLEKVAERPGGAMRRLYAVNKA